MRIAFLKLLDKVIGLPFVFLAGIVPVCNNSVSTASILVIRPGGIGDGVLLIPVLGALKEKFPAARITVLAEKRNCAVFDLCLQVDRVLKYDCPAEFMAAVRGGYDVAIDSEQWHYLSAVVARLTGAPLLIGYGTNQRARLFNVPLGYSHDDYEYDSFLNLIKPLGVETLPLPDSFLTIPEAAHDAACRLLNGLEADSFVAIFPGASIAERRWGSDRFHELAKLLASNGTKVVVVGGNDDHEQGESIVAGGVGLDLAGRTSLAETAAVIKRSALLVSGDSGVLHLAVGLGKPTVSLFGPGRASKWAPRGKQHIVINKELPCSPCTTYGNTPDCPVGAKCMKVITVQEVFDAVNLLLPAH